MRPRRSESGGPGRSRGGEGPERGDGPVVTLPEEQADERVTVLTPDVAP
jgi:hypothetical protein